MANPRSPALHARTRNAASELQKHAPNWRKVAPWVAVALVAILLYAAWRIWGRQLVVFAYYRNAGITNAQAGLTSSDELVRQAAARSLGESRHKAIDVIPDLIPVLNDPSPQIAGDAAWALGCIMSSHYASTTYYGSDAVNRDRATLALIEALSHPDGRVRNQAAYAISLNADILQSHAAIPRLTELLADPLVAYRAAGALGNMGFDARPAIPKIAALLTSPNPGARAEAAIALAKLQPLPSDVVQAIEPLRNDPVDWVQRFAKEALKTIPPSSPTK